MLDRIDRLPGPNGLYVFGLFLLEWIWTTALLWANRDMPFGSFDLRRTFIVVIAPYLLFVRFRLDRAATTAMDAFRPALAVGDDEFHRLRYELTTLPARTTWVVTAFALLSYVVNAALLPDWIVKQFGTTRLSSAVILAPVGFLTMAVVGISTAQAIRQLWMVDLIHGLARKVSLFRAKPLYAFSRLTSRTGVSLLLLAYYVAAARPEIVRDTPVLKLLIVATVPTAVACFIVPLYGMHLRLVAEKHRLLEEAGSRFECIIGRLHERVDQDVLADADKLNNQLSSIVAEREAIAQVSTWPWDAAAVTGLVTTLVLPVILWLVQRLLGRLGV